MDEKVVVSFFKPSYYKSLKNCIKNRKGYQGSFDYKGVNIELRDFYGWKTGRGGLKSLLQVLNISHPFKDIFDEKDKMEKYVQFPEFLEYGIYDVITLEQIPIRMEENINNLLKEAYHMSSIFLFENNLPRTVGSMVATIFQKFLYHSLMNEMKTGTEEEKLNRLLKLSINVSLPRKKLLNKNLGLKKKEKLSSSERKHMLNTASVSDVYLSRLFEKGSVRTLAWTGCKTTAVLNALVSGGRASNEFIDIVRAENVLDVDFVSCYGSALRDFYYPIGSPTIYSEDERGFENGESLTLREFLEKYEKKVITNMYTITVSGKLSFPQNIIYSKVLDWKKLNKKIHSILENEGDDEEDDSTDIFQSNFVLFSHEIINGIITSDILEILKKICTNQEWKEILDFKVITAIFYEKQHEMTDVDTFLQELEKNGAKSTKWLRIPINNFVNPLLQMRKGYKAQKSEAKTPEEKKFYDSKQSFLKLIVNTLYGSLASRFFSIGSTVVANNITARARGDIFLMKSVLRAFQCITDGVTYTPTVVYRLKNGRKKPGLRYYSSHQSLESHPSIEKTSLGEVEWENEFLQKAKEHPIDKMVKEHIETFWAVYDLKVHYDLEHKPEHTANVIAFLRKADYALKINGFYLIKVRGVHEDDTNQPVAYYILINLLEQKDPLITNLTHFQMVINTVTDYFMSLKRNEIDPTQEILIPGYHRYVEITFHLGMEDFIYPYFSIWKKEISKKIDYTIFIHLGIQYMLRMRLEDYNKVIHEFSTKNS